MDGMVCVTRLARKKKEAEKKWRRKKKNRKELRIENLSSH